MTVPASPPSAQPASGAPKVSVAMVTYNHEKFITQAIDSVLMQQTDFPYELVIGEDCSRDRTREIVSDYQRRYPSRIRLLLHGRNVGAMENFVETLRACRGQYVALLDGDDYWTDPHKLQLQADYLDEHPECAMCFHNAQKLYDDGSRPTSLYYRSDGRSLLTMRDLLAGNFLPTCGVVARNGLFGELPAWSRALSVGDWPFHVLNAQFGLIGYIDRVMGAYRIHNVGVWSATNKIQRLKNQIEVYEAFRAHLEPRYVNAIQVALSRCHLKLSSQHERRGERRQARRSAASALAAGMFRRGADHKDLWKRFVTLSVPGLRRIAPGVARTL